MSATAASIIQTTSFAKRRLLRDLKELNQEQPNLLTVSAHPTNDIFHWRACLRPDDGPYAGTVFHIKMDFQATYPRDPPDVTLCTSIPHPNVFENSICLDMLESHLSSTPYEGWTAAYSVTSVLLQLQSFLFAENIPQDYGGDKKASTDVDCIQFAIQRAKQFKSKILLSDGSEVVHTHDFPWPPLPKQKAKEQLSVHDPLSPMTGKTTTRTKRVFVPWTKGLPVSVLSNNIFGYLTPRDIVTVRNVCSDWRRVVMEHNVFERSQLSCFYTKKTMDDADCILGVGIAVQYHPKSSGLKSISSSLDVLSLEAFAKEGVRQSVFDKSTFDFFLPLILNREHAAKARPHAEKTIYEIMRNLPCPLYSNIQRAKGTAERLYPHMILQLLTTLMNNMIVDLMTDADSHGDVRRHASEKALEGFCAYHHMLLHYSRVYPSIEEMANKQVNDFIIVDNASHKNKTPDLGNFLVCLTLSSKGWQFLWKAFILEMFDRNVRWLLRKKPSLGFKCDDLHRLNETFHAIKTSLRLLMFQVHFLSHVGRPSNTKGPADVLAAYDRRLGYPTMKQKEDLQLACKSILQVNTWNEFFLRCQVPVPSETKLAEMLFQAVRNSHEKGYHTPGKQPSTGRRKPRNRHQQPAQR